MADVTVKRLDEMEAIEGYFEGFKFHRARESLGVTAFGISVLDMPPSSTEYPEHDHSEEGIGGEMFKKRPGQLGQEEVYIALRGSGVVEVDGERYPLDAEHFVRVGPRTRRKVISGEAGLRLLALGAVPGAAYQPG